MAIPLKQSTASQEVLLGPFLDATDGVTAETALTIANTDIKLWKAGGTTEASKNSGGATHIASGRYYAVLDATDTDTLGPMEINVAVSGALPVRRECWVLPANVYDSLFGSDLFQVDVTQFGGTNATTSGGRPEVNTTHLAGTAYASADLSATMKASVNAEVVDAVNTDTYAEPGQEAPPATTSLAKKIGYLYKLARNKVTQSSTTMSVYADDGTTVDQKATVTDDGSTYTRGEITSGP